MTDERPQTLDENLAAHTSAVSSGMVGVGLTVLGLFRVSDRLRDVSNIGEMLLSILRSRKREPRRRMERVADGLFLAGLVLMALIGALISYELV